ncbi:MAG TPA: SurA N-terminal domain-containing protein [Devosia sp.]|nr:SurA N-terminal domain-containing protein [Devosia sp.]
MLRPLRLLFAGFALFLLVVPALAASIAVTVNGEGITDLQVARRLALFKLEGKSGQKTAQDELINEMLMVQEATRLGFTVTADEIDAAYLQIARNLKVSASNLTQVLTTRGVDPQTLRDRLKANVAWNKVIGSAVSQRVNVSEADIEAEAESKLTAANSYDYILKEVLFIMAPGGASASKRTADANAYRKAFAGCDSAVQLSLNYTDAAVRDVGRRHATQFPDALADELSKLNVGGITKPRVVETGVSMLAVCAKSVSDDTTFLAGKLRQQTGNAKLKQEADKYLAELKAKAQIIYS